jgi:hypothetical protein
MAYVRGSQAGAYIEIEGKKVRVSQARTYIEVSGEILRVSQVGAYIEIKDPTPAKTRQTAYLSGPHAVHAYLHGQDTASSDTPAFASGIPEATTSIPAYLFGASRWVPAFLSGSSSATDAQSAYLYGVIFASGSTNAFMQGVKLGRDYQFGYLKGSVSVSDDLSAYLFGCIAITSSVPAFCTSAEVSVKSKTKAYLSAHVSSSVSAYSNALSISVDYGTLSSADYSQSFAFRVLAEGYSDGILETGVFPNQTIGGGLDVSKSTLKTMFDPTIKIRHTEEKPGYGTLDDLKALYALDEVLFWKNHYGVEYPVRILGPFEKFILSIRVEGTSAWYIVRLHMVEP